ncbi:MULTISPECIES: ParB/RepB/Spo0J family partition protein [unclassified Agrococcus]|uniref:ParB/RepB/Spo0J family partition protein n=1 Tax=unclassified Agrococcus TaxID=2615065 RepID=UPI003613EADD
MSKRTGLGRGIGALIPTAPVDTEAPTQPAQPRERPVDVFFPAAKTTDGQELAAVPGARLAELPLDAIVPNHVQPRDVFDEDDLTELEHSIREFGVLQPIVVRPMPGDAERFELIMGERRWRASRRAGKATVPALIRETSDEAMLRDALLENLHRADLNPLEEASAYQQLMADFSITQEELSRRIGRSRPQISNTIRLLRLPETIQTRVASGVLSAGHARAILSVDGEDAMQRLADRIVNEELSVRAAEHAASVVQVKVPRRTPQRGGVQRGLDEVAERLTDRLDTRVRVSLGRTKGQIVVDFATVADLNRILSELGEPPFGDAVSLSE